ncbi:unnamed protein product, partial [Dovyalis caffra]
RAYGDALFDGDGFMGEDNDEAWWHFTAKVGVGLCGKMEAHIGYKTTTRYLKVGQLEGIIQGCRGLLA